MQDDLATKYLYAGEQYDADMQNYYLRARYYVPIIGRFNRIDPFAGNTEDPQSPHKYLYCHANPVNNTDSRGLFGTLMDVMNTAYVRSVLGNIQLSVADYAFFSAEAARAGWSVGRAFKWGLAIAVGTVVFAWLLGKALNVIQRLPSLFRSSADDLPRGVTYSGRLWRGVHPDGVADAWKITKYSYGGFGTRRYSQIGRGTLYTGKTYMTAYKEVAAHINPTSRVFVSRDFTVDNLLDLRDSHVREWLGVDLDDLTRTVGDDAYFMTEAIGDFARTRYNGMLVPSTRDAGATRVVMFKGLL